MEMHFTQTNITQFMQKTLKSRFALITTVVALIIAIAAGWWNVRVKQEQVTLTNDLQERSVVLNHTSVIRDAIWRSRAALDNFLLSPDNHVYLTQFRAAIIEAVNTINHLSEHSALHTDTFTREIAGLLESLSSLEIEMMSVVKLRRNPEQLFPVFKVLDQQLLPLTNRYLSMVALALDELNSEAPGLQNKLMLIEINEARYGWMKMISAFRSYVSNILSNLDSEKLVQQESEILLFHDISVKHITKLEIEAKKRDSGELQLNESLREMRVVSKEWLDLFSVVQEIRASGRWREDINHLDTKINPLLEKIWEHLLALNEVTDSTVDNRLTQFSRNVNQLTIAISLLAALGIIVVIATFFHLDKVVLKPLKNLTIALKKQAKGEMTKDISAEKFLEIQELINAFNFMHKQIEQRQSDLKHQALHDGLTGLPNRALLLDRIQQVIKESQRTKITPALIMMDLNRFKEINDTLGHQVGDILLQEVSIRLKNVLRDMDTIARLGGDEFAILLHDIDLDDTKIVATKIINSLNQPFQVETHQLLIGASLGIAIFPEHGDSDSELIRHADIAMYVAKKNRLGYSIYSATEDQNSISNLSIASELRDAINNDELELYYQPKFSLRENKTVEAEALLRWIHPEKGFISPEKIIVAAEESGLIHPLTEWIIEKAICQTSNWNNQGIYIGVAVNLSVFNLQNPHLVTIVRYMLDSAQLESGKLILEITESAMMANPKLAAGVLSLLDAMGIKIAIDDFGTGYSSLAYLKNLPVDELKIDRSFVMNLATDKSDAAIVKSTIDLAHNLGLSVVAEGIEDKESWDILHEMGCDLIQGYYLAKPMPAEDFEHWFIEHSLDLLRAQRKA